MASITEEDFRSSKYIYVITSVEFRDLHSYEAELTNFTLHWNKCTEKYLAICKRGFSLHLIVALLSENAVAMKVSLKWWHHSTCTESKVKTSLTRVYMNATFEPYLTEILKKLIPCLKVKIRLIRVSPASTCNQLVFMVYQDTPVYTLFLPWRCWDKNGLEKIH